MTLYCAAVTNPWAAELLAPGGARVRGFRLVEPAEIASDNPDSWRWWVCEDTEAPESFRGKLVRPWVDPDDNGVLTITSRCTLDVHARYTCECAAGSDRGGGVTADPVPAPVSWRRR